MHHIKNVGLLISLFTWVQNRQLLYHVSQNLPNRILLNFDILFI